MMAMMATLKRLNAQYFMLAHDLSGQVQPWVFVGLCDGLQGFTTSQMTDPVTIQFWDGSIFPIPPACHFLDHLWESPFSATYMQLRQCDLTLQIYESNSPEITKSPEIPSPHPKRSAVRPRKSPTKPCRETIVVGN